MSQCVCTFGRCKDWNMIHKKNTKCIHLELIPLLSLLMTFHTIAFPPKCITTDGAIFGSNIIGILEKCNDKGELLDNLRYGRGGNLYKDNPQVAMYTESLPNKWRWRLFRIGKIRVCIVLLSNLYSYSFCILLWEMRC